MGVICSGEHVRELFLQWREFANTTVSILGHADGSYTVREVNNEGAVDDEGFDTGLDVLSTYVQFNAGLPGPNDEYEIALDEFMHDHFTDEQWALAALETL